MKYAHLLSHFYFSPWNLRSVEHMNFGRLLQGHLRGEEMPLHVHHRRSSPNAAFRTGQPVVGPTIEGTPVVPQMEVSGGVAVIPVHGVLGKRLAMLELLCGGADYEHLSEFFTMALHDPAVRVVVLDFDTPGGACHGLPECAAILEALAAAKPVLAYSEGLCCSAGFYLACYAREFYASPSSSVGNIGTVLAAQDTSREWEMNGWRLELFASGALKAAGFDGKEWTEAERAFFQYRMEKKFAEFKAVVNTHRPQVAAECFDARWLDGDVAPNVGLTDGVSPSLAHLVSDIALAVA